MNYLKCSNCGHLNLVKTEYQVFCSNCNKKLENNFQNWKKKHPEKSFEDFKQLVCVSEEDLLKTTSDKRPKRKGLKYWLAFTILFAIFYAIGEFGGESIVNFFKSEKTSKLVLKQKWTKNRYGFGLTVETPVKLTKDDLPLPDNVKKVIDQMYVYDYMSEKGFKIMINSIKYKPVIKRANLQGAANGSVNKMKSQKGVTNFNYTQDTISNNGIPGFLQKGTYQQNGIEAEFMNAGFAKGILVWQVIVVYQKDDDVGRIAAKRVINSIEIHQD